MRTQSFLRLAGLVVGLAWAVGGVRAQSVAVSAATSTYAAAGGSVTVLVEVRYGEVASSGLGVELVLPAGWSYRATQGATIPQVTPEAGDAGSLGWAYVTVPPGAAQFSVLLDYRSGLAGEQVMVVKPIFRPAPAQPVAVRKIVFGAAPKK